MFVYTIQPVVRFDNRLDNRFYRVNGVYRSRNIAKHGELLYSRMNRPTSHDKRYNDREMTSPLFHHVTQIKTYEKLYFRAPKS